MSFTWNGIKMIQVLFLIEILLLYGFSTASIVEAGPYDPPVDCTIWLTVELANQL